MILTIIAYIICVAVCLGLAHMATETRNARRSALPRPTVPADWRRPDVQVYITPNGDLVSQETKA